MPESLSLVLTTFADEDSAAKVVTQLVEERLAACGNLIPGARSIYRWKNAIEDAREVIVLLKTSTAQSALLIARLKELHPYETPEILTWTPDSADAAYSAWVMDSVGTLKAL